MRYLVPALVIALGITLVVLGGADDSPGLQLIGVLLVLGTITYTVRAALAARHRE